MATFCKKVDLKKQINFQCEKLIVDWSAAISDQILVLLLFCFTIGVRWNSVTSRLLLVRLLLWNAWRFFHRKNLNWNSFSGRIII